MIDSIIKLVQTPELAKMLNVSGGLILSGAMVWVIYFMLKSNNKNNDSWREQIQRNEDRADERARDTNMVIKEITEVIRGIKDEEDRTRGHSFKNRSL